MRQLTRRRGVRQADPRPKSVPVRNYRRRPPRKKTPQQRLAEYRQAHRRLWQALRQPIFPPRTTRRRNGLRSVRLAWEGAGSGSRGGAAWASHISSAILQT